MHLHQGMLFQLVNKQRRRKLTKEAKKVNLIASRKIINGHKMYQLLSPPNQNENNRRRMIKEASCAKGGEGENFFFLFIFWNLRLETTWGKEREKLTNRSKACNNYVFEPTTKCMFGFNVERLQIYICPKAIL